MFSALSLAALLAAAPAAPQRDARVELDAVAAQIERLKARHLAGQDVASELEGLLVKARELAAEIERGAPPVKPPPPAAAAGPSPEELRERADALRDEADRGAAAAKELEAQIEEARRAARLEAGLESLLSESNLFGEAGMTRLGGRAPGKTATLLDATPVNGVATVTSPPSTALAPTGAQGRGGATLPASAADRVSVLRASRARALARAAALRGEADALDAQAKAIEDAER